MSEMTGSTTRSRTERCGSIGFGPARRFSDPKALLAAWFATALLVTGAAASLVTAQSPAPRIPKPRLAVVPAPDPSGTNESLANVIMTELTADGFAILAPRWHPRPTQNGTPDFVGQADLVVEVKAGTLTRNRRQGRYRVAGTITIRVRQPGTGLDRARKRVPVAGTSFFGYREAREALVTDFKLGDVLTAIQDYTKDEARDGLRLLVNLGLGEPRMDTTVQRAIEAAEGVVAGSLESKEISSGEGTQPRVLYFFRYRGAMAKLRSHLRQAIRQADTNARTAIRAAPRSLRIDVTPGQPPVAGEEQVRAEVKRMLDDLAVGRERQLAALDGTIEATVEHVEDDGVTVIQSVMNQAKTEAATARLRQEVEKSVRERRLFKSLKPNAQTKIQAKLRTFDDTCVLDGKLVDGMQSITEVIHAVTDPVGAVLLQVLER